MSTTLTDKNSNGFPARSGVAAGDFISSAEMNQHLDALGERTNYLYTMGIYPHNATFNYPIGAFCQDNGTVYRAQVGNAGKPPASNPSFWVKCPMTKDEIIADVNLGSYATTAQMNTGLSSKQNTDATLTALANLTTAADQIPYATGADAFAMTPLTPFARTLLDDANAAAALATLGAAPLVSPALTGTPTAPTAAVGTNTTQVATTAFVSAESQIAAPVGSVYTFAGATVPTGWLKCNGAWLSRTTYAALFAVIGTTYGAGDGSTTFALPDLRGEFIRGWDDGRGIDAGRSLGSWQDATMIGDRVGINSTDGLVLALRNGDNITSQTASSTGWGEAGTGLPDNTLGDHVTYRTRPRNVAMHYIIKY